MSWFRRNRAYLLVVGLLLFALLLFIANMKRPANRNWLDRALLWVSAPVQEALTWAIDGAVDTWESYVFLVGLREQNRQLKSRIEELELEVARLREAEAENARLRELVDMRERLPAVQTLAARVVGVGTSPVARTIRIAAGTDDGVQMGAAVISGAGLVGRVINVVGDYAEVQLVVDGRSAVDVVIQRSRARGIVRGRGEDELCSVDHLVRTADVEVGDTAVTSGVGGIHPPGLPVGTINRVTSPEAGVFREADLEPAVDFQSLEEVLVVLPRSQIPGGEGAKE